MENEDDLNMRLKIEKKYEELVNGRDKLLEYLTFHMKNHTDFEWYMNESTKSDYKKLFRLNFEIILLEELMK